MRALVVDIDGTDEDARFDAIDELVGLFETLGAEAAESLADPDLAQAWILAGRTLVELPPDEVPLDEPAIVHFRRIAQQFAELGRAADVYPTVLELSHELHQSRGASATLELLENCIDVTADPAVSRWYMFRAAEVARQAQDFAANLRWLNRFDEVLGDDDVARCYSWGGWGARYLQLGVQDAAYRMFRREMQAANQVESQQDVVRMASLLHRTRFHLSCFDYETAERLAAEILDGATAPSRWTAWAHFAQGLSRTHQAWAGTGDTKAAEDSFRRALETSGVGAGDRQSFLLGLARLHLSEGHAERARPVLDEARAAIDVNPLRASLDVGQLAALEARAALFSGSDRADLEDHHRRLEQAFHQLLEEWNAVPVRAGGLGFLHFGERRIVVTELIALTLHLGDRSPASQRQAARYVLQAQQLGTMARLLRLPDVTVGDLQGTLDPGEGVASLLTSAERSFLVLITAENVRVEENGGNYEFLFQARRTREAILEVEPNRLTGPAGADELTRATHAAAELSRRLFSDDVQDELGRLTAIRIVGQDLIEWVPVEALPVGGQALGLSHRVSYWPSIPVGCELRRRSLDATHVEGALLVLAPAVEGRTDLTLNEGERRRLRAPLDSARILEGRGATRDALRAGLSADLAMLHVFTHGEHDYELERSAALMLTPGLDDSGLLTCEDAQALKAPPLVVLSACGAARGPLRAGDDGVGHLGGAFLLAGAHAVISSRADLERDATLAMLEALHQELATGRSADEALRRARREVSSRPEWQHPFFWSTLHVVGDGSRPIFPTSEQPNATTSAADAPPLTTGSSSWAWWTGAGVLAAVLVLLGIARGRRRAHT